MSEVIENQVVIPKKAPVVFTYGIPLGIFYVIGPVFYMIRSIFQPPFWYTLIIWLGVFGILFAAAKAYRARFPEGIEFKIKHAFGVGILASIVAGVISSIIYYICLKLIFTDYMDGMMQHIAQMQMEMTGNAQAVEMSTRVMSLILQPWFMAGSMFINCVICGAICAVVAGALTKRAAAA